MITVLVAGLISAAGPSPGDAPAHLYRTLLVHEGVYVWDNFWYAGSYSLAPYSLFYYFPAAVVGNVPLVFAAVVSSTILFASIALREWGDAAVWPARVFGVLAAAPLFTGLYTYALGFAVMLAALKALQLRRTVLAISFAVLTVGFSPLAFGFLCLIAGATFASRLHVSRRTLVTAAGLTGAAGIEVAAVFLFPKGEGYYPFHWIDFAGVLTVSLLGTLLARRAPAARGLSAFFVLWGLGSIVAFAVRSPVGDNWTRLYGFALPLMLLTARLVDFRPRRLAALAIGAALVYNLTPYLLLVPYRLDNRSASATYWQPAIGFLDRHLKRGFRVEVVPTASHWESFWIPKAGIPLARGWYKQVDEIDNPTLYSGRLNRASYGRWLHASAVAFVLLPGVPLDPSTVGPAEARIVTSSRPGLQLVFRSPAWRIYRVARPTPLITGPGRVRIAAFTQTTLAMSVSMSGRYLVRSHFNPYLRLKGLGCITRAAGNMIWVDARRPGRFALTVPSSADGVVKQVTSRSSAC